MHVSLLSPRRTNSGKRKQKKSYAPSYVYRVSSFAFTVERHLNEIP